MARARAQMIFEHPEAGQDVTVNYKHTDYEGASKPKWSGEGWEVST